MDISAVMDDKTLTNYDWISDSVGILDGGSDADISRMKSPNNCRPELDVQWGDGMILVDEPAGVVQRNPPEHGDWDVGERVVLFARDLMNRGVEAREMARRVRSKFGSKVVDANRQLLASQAKLDGIAGCIAVDARGYKSCREALASGSLSPNKRHIRYVIGCNCGTPHRLPVASETIGEQSAEGINSTDTFLAMNDSGKPCYASHCHKTMRPILSGALGESETKSILASVAQTNSIPKSVVAGILRKNRGLRAVQAAFRWINARDAAAAEQKYKGSVNTAEYVVHKSEFPVEIVDPSVHTPMSGGFAAGSELPELDVVDASCPALGVTVGNVEPEVDVDSAMCIDMDCAGTNIEIPVDFGMAGKPIDVDEQPYAETEWELNDDIELEPLCERDRLKVEL